MGISVHAGQPIKQSQAPYVMACAAFKSLGGGWQAALLPRLSPL